MLFFQTWFIVWNGNKDRISNYDGSNVVVINDDAITDEYGESNHTATNDVIVNEDVRLALSTLHIRLVGLPIRLII